MSACLVCFKLIDVASSCVNATDVCRRERGSSLQLIRNVHLLAVEA